MSSEFRFQLIMLAKKVWPGASSHSGSVDETNGGGGGGQRGAERYGSSVARGPITKKVSRNMSSEYQPDRDSLLVQPPQASIISAKRASFAR